MDLDKVSILAVAEELLGPVNQERSTKREKHFHGHNGLFVNVDKNLWYSHGESQGGDAVTLLKHINGLSPREAFEWLEDRGYGDVDDKPPPSKQARTLVKTYNYHAPTGEVRFSVNRYSDKTFAQWRSINGETVWGLRGGQYSKTADGWRRVNGVPTSGMVKEMPDTEPLPYRLLDIMRSDPKDVVLIPGGEKDVDNLWSMGFVATTNPGGEGNWTSGLSIWLQNRRVCILCDNDEMGEKHQEVIGEALADFAKEIRVLRFPELQAKGDVSDFIEQRILSGKTQSKIFSELKMRCAQAPRWKADSPFVLTCLADVEPEAIDWIWPGHLAKGKITLLGGDPDLGKSNITIDIAARLSAGRGLEGENLFKQNGPIVNKPCSVVFLCSEDGLKDTIRPRAEAAGSDLYLLHALDSCIVRNKRLSRFSLGADLDLLGQAVNETKASLVIIDAITSYMGKVDDKSTTDIRSVLDPISNWAERYNVAVLGVTHPPKSSQANAIRQFTGSFAYVAAARLAFFVTKDPDSDRGLFMPVKNNIGEKAIAKGYKIDKKEIRPGIVAPYIIWDDAPVPFTADEAVALARKSVSSSGGKLEDAVNFLKEYLKDGPKTCIDTRDEARKKIITEITLRRAREFLRIETTEGGGKEATWKLPSAEVIQLYNFQEENEDDSF